MPIRTRQFKVGRLLWHHGRQRLGIAKRVVHALL